MTITLTWLGHSAFSIAIDGRKLLIDPFITNNPLATVSADSLEAEVILVTHAHADHIGDTVSIAKRTGATVVATPEICHWLSKQGVETLWEGNTGGTYRGDFFEATWTMAFHTCSLPDGSYGGQPMGFLIRAQGKTIYHAGDTGLFGDMRLLGEAGIDVALLPIGDKYTMGISDSVRAVQFLKPQYVIPMHFNTFPPIAQDASAWAERVHRETSAKPIVLDPSGEFTIT